MDLPSPPGIFCAIYGAPSTEAVAVSTVRVSRLESKFESVAVDSRAAEGADELASMFKPTSSVSFERSSGDLDLLVNTLTAGINKYVFHKKKGHRFIFRSFFNFSQRFTKFYVMLC